MKSPRRKPLGGRAGRRSLCLVAPLAFVLGLGACDSLSLSREPETARIRIVSDDVSEVSLVTSRWFVEVADPDCVGCPSAIQLVVGDTTTVSLPFEETYPLTARLQFFAEAQPSAGVPVRLSMKAWVDDREWYNGSRTLEPEDANGEPETLRFVYQYTRARLP